MQFIDKTLQTTAENLAVDEWMLEACELSTIPRELFRVWENPWPAVVLGRSSKFANEVNESGCQQSEIEIFRRCSGGSAVVIGPGCLMYAVVLDYRNHPELRMLDEAHRFVMKRTQAAIVQSGIDVEYQGTCDLTMDNRKFSGNSLRCKRNCLLYHGTLLYDFPLHVIGECLKAPPRQPDYRAGRSHELFVCNLPVSQGVLEQNLLDVWKIEGNESPADLTDFDCVEVQKLVDSKYATSAWTKKL